MGKRFIGEIALIVFLLFFSWWLMTKSFGYDGSTSQFRIARHEVGDFGLHIGLMRSFVQGENLSPESPFFSGKPLVYHYAVDWLAGQFVRLGLRIDYAVNGISAAALTILLYGLFQLTVLSTKGSKAAGMLSVLLFILPGNLSFVEIFKRAPRDFSFFSYFWRFPDYIHQGPFDGSMITIYSTLSPYLNQRHLIAGMAIAMTVIWITVRWLGSGTPLKDSGWILLGVVIGASTRVHIVVAAATAITVVILLLGRRNRSMLLFGCSAVLAALPHLIELFSVRLGTGASQFWNPGYLTPRPFSLTSWSMFWIYNLGIFVALIPLCFRSADTIGRRLILSAGVLFIVANAVQVSARIEHNHSFINIAIVLILPCVARLLVSWWARRGFRWKSVAVIAFVISTASGLVNLIVVKNDFQFNVDDVARNPFMQWVNTKTDTSSIFISKHALYDPIALAGRKNYLGLEYYVSVMGYDYWGRRKQIDMWLGNFNLTSIAEMKKQDIDYIALPSDRKDFPYVVEESEIQQILPVVYRDETITVYEL